jgi:outer membrane usher protein
MLQAMLLSSGFQAAIVHAKGIQFNAAFLPMDSRDLDLNQYREGNPIKPGTYRADVLVNGSLRTRHDIRIEGEPDGSTPVICMTPKLLHTLGVDPRHVQGTTGDEDCVELPLLVDGATASFTIEDQQLLLSIPQVALIRQARGYVSPELWDAGVTAAILGYSFSAHTVKSPAGSHDSASLWLDGGFNIGSWRMRHVGSMRWNGQAGARYEALDSFVQHDLTSWRSQLTAGQTSTRSDVFDTLRFEGVQLASDDRMLPSSLRGYAPVVRGIARTTARVAVRQGGNLLLETTVAPGAFVIDDLYATGYGGNLDVTVYEDDGTEQNYVVPYASVNQLLRPGTARYAATAGRLRSPYLDQAQFFLQGELQYGLSNRLTTYGGLQVAEGYLSLVGGMAFATPIGAMAVDLSHATATIGNGKHEGQSLRLSYSKQLLAQGTNFSLAAYRFSTRGYLDFATAALHLDAGGCLYDCFRPQSRLAVNIDQQLGRL